MSIPNGKEMAGVMMATTMLNALLMEGTVVEMMSRQPSALTACAFNKSLYCPSIFL